MSQQMKINCLCNSSFYKDDEKCVQSRANDNKNRIKVQVNKGVFRKMQRKQTNKKREFNEN